MYVLCVSNPAVAAKSNKPLLFSVRVPPSAVDVCVCDCVWPYVLGLCLLAYDPKWKLSKLRMVTSAQTAASEYFR